MERTNEVLKAAIGLVAGPGSVALSFEDRLSLLLRLSAMALGCLVSMAMFWSIVSGRLDKKHEAVLRMEREREELMVQKLAYQREAALLCHLCQQGKQPPECPLPSDKCPMKKKSMETRMNSLESAARLRGDGV